MREDDESPRKAAAPRASGRGAGELRGGKGAAAALALLAFSCSTARDLPAKPSAPLRSAAEAGAPTSIPVLAASTTIAGEKIEFPTSPVPMVVSRLVTIRPGQSTGWHAHGVPTFGYFLSGTLEVEYADGTRRTFHPGEALVEATPLAHHAVNLGPEDVRILVVSMTAQGKPLAVNAPAPAMPAGLGGTRASDLVDLSGIDSELRIDLRYARAENFTGRVIYRGARALLQRPAAEALSRANARARREGYALLVLDAYRPWSVTRTFWDEYPMHRGFLADPLQGSRHNRGCAVDLTLVDLRTGREVAMPSAYDDFSEKAHPSYRGGSAAEREARDRLRGWMEAEGFTVYENEWWHFDYEGWKEWPVLDLAFDAAAP
jgi:D-alanyl-D-alanine dipeptidase